jgi:pseudouridine-5'-phosphate glycosidase
VVALESTVITHGLARPDNLRVARRMIEAVREGGALPAVIALMDGEVRVGLDEEALVRLAEADAEKASLWNLAAILAARKAGGTTVAATAHFAHRAGIPVFATGGIGGVHPVRYDESADLMALSRTPILMVSSGMKSILDLEATLERLETLGVAVAGYRTDRLPAFHSPASPYPLPARVKDAAEAAAVFEKQRALGLPSALLVFNPVSEGLPFEEVRAYVEAANREAREKGIHGKALTPYLLRRLAELTGGATDRVNRRLLVENAALAAKIAAALARR